MTDPLYDNVAVDRARFRRTARRTGPFPVMSAAQFLKPYSEGGFIAEYDGGLWAINPIEFEVIPLNGRVPRRERRIMKSGFAFSINQQFATVMNECAKPRPNGQYKDQWLTQKLALGFLEQYHLGAAHSFEVWRDGILVGGMFGMQAGGLFTALSLFSREKDAGKTVFAQAKTVLCRRGFELFLGSLPSNTSRFFGGLPQTEQAVLPVLRSAVTRQLAIPPQPAILLA